MEWGDAVELVRPHVVKIETPGGHGTGFLTFYNYERTWCGIATAAHVVAYADEWQQPIRVRSEGSTSPRFLNAADRVIFLDGATDSAVVLFFKGELQLPEIPIALMPMGQPCEIGADVGWLGFPAIEPNTLCFFNGAVSARAAGNSYLIDGVAIHGVSGGPVFHASSVNGIRIIGCVSAYHANTATGASLPGLLRAQNVSHFHISAETVRTIDEARVKKTMFDEAMKHAATGPQIEGAAPQIKGRLADLDP